MALPSPLFRHATRQSRAVQCDPQRKSRPRPPHLLGSLPGLDLPALRPPRLLGSLLVLALELAVLLVLAPLPRSQEEQPPMPRSSISILASFFLLLFSPELLRNLCRGDLSDSGFYPAQQNRPKIPSDIFLIADRCLHSFPEHRRVHLYISRIRRPALVPVFIAAAALLAAIHHRRPANQPGSIRWPALRLRASPARPAHPVAGARRESQC